MNITIKILNRKGDNVLTYNAETQLEEAQKQFGELKSKGYSLFSVDPETKETKLVDQLFQTETQVIAVPQIAGG